MIFEVRSFTFSLSYGRHSSGQMGKRKFRLSQRERNKYQKTNQFVVSIPFLSSTQTVLSSNNFSSINLSEPLIISIPITVYSNGTIVTSKQLLERLQYLKVVMNGWSIEGDSIVRGIFSVVTYGTMRITISSDCHWTMFINEYKIHLQNHTLLQFSEEVLDTCDKVVKLLSKAEQSRLCIGNPDTKFDEIRDRRKGWSTR